MHVRTRSHAGTAATGVAVVGIAAIAATPLAPATDAQSQLAASHDVRLAAAAVPPGGLITSFLGNQVIYCSAICPPLINTGVTAALTTLQTPAAFAGALQSGDLLKAIGITAASVTGPTNDALAAAILADTTVAVPKASNAFEVAVVGLLNIAPAAAGGLPAVGAAIEAARQQTFDALNLPVPVTGPTVMPQGVVQVAAISAIRVGEAVIFPAFNDVLQATVGVPDAAAQELAASGDPARAAAAGVTATTAICGRGRQLRRELGGHRDQRYPQRRRAVFPWQPVGTDPAVFYDDNAGPSQGETTAPVGHDCQRLRALGPATHIRCATWRRRRARLRETSSRTSPSVRITRQTPGLSVGPFAGTAF